MAPNVTSVDYINNHITNVLANVVYKVATITSTTNLTGANIACFLTTTAASIPTREQGAGDIPLKVEKKATGQYNFVH